MRSWEWILRYHGHDDLTAKIPCPGITTWKWLQRLGRATTLTATSAGFHQWSVHNWHCLQFRIIIYYHIIKTITVWYCPYHGFHQLVPLPKITVMSLSVAQCSSSLSSSSSATQLRSGTNTSASYTARTPEYQYDQHRRVMSPPNLVTAWRRYPTSQSLG